MLINDLFETQILTDGVHDPQIFKAVFMAGAPGSGKSTIAHKLFAHTGLRALNVDDFWQLYRTKNKPGNYEKYWELYKKKEKHLLDGRIGLLIDGTARNPEKMAEVKNRLEELGYETAMVFVNATLGVSWQRVQHRAEKSGREIEREFVENTWNQVQRGLGKLQNIFQERFFIIDNNRKDVNLKYASKSLDRWLSTPPMKMKAQEWIKQQKEIKNTAKDDIDLREASQDIKVNSPRNIPDDLIHKLVDLVAKGGEVAMDVVYKNIKSSPIVAWVETDNKPIAVGVLKTPMAVYRQKVFQSAGKSELVNKYKLELGYIYVEPDFRSQGLASGIVNSLSRANVYATTRENNSKMNSILQNAGFVQAGNPYPSARGDYKIILWTKN